MQKMLPSFQIMNLYDSAWTLNSFLWSNSKCIQKKLQQIIRNLQLWRISKEIIFRIRTVWKRTSQLRIYQALISIRGFFRNTLFSLINAFSFWRLKDWLQKRWEIRGILKKSAENSSQERQNSQTFNEMLQYIIPYSFESMNWKRNVEVYWEIYRNVQKVLKEIWATLGRILFQLQIATHFPKEKNAFCIKSASCSAFHQWRLGKSTIENL